MIPRDGLCARALLYVQGPYWSGTDCLKLGMPWFTPEAINALLKDDLFAWMRGKRVLEMGSGGSTLFFADAAGEVVSFETNFTWYQTMQKRAGTSVSLYNPKSLEQLERLLKGSDKFDILLLDNDDFKRTEVASLILPLAAPKAIFISDNYYLPDNIVREFTVPTDWKHHDFNDKHWHGCGTRISTRGF